MFNGKSAATASGAVPITPITELELVLTVLIPSFISVTLIPCEKLGILVLLSFIVDFNF